MGLDALNASGRYAYKAVPTPLAPSLLIPAGRVVTPLVWLLGARLLRDSSRGKETKGFFEAGASVAAVQELWVYHIPQGADMMSYEEELC